MSEDLPNIPVVQESNQAVKTPEELGEMFDNGFLRILQRFCNEGISDKHFSEKPHSFILNLQMHFPYTDAELTYEDIKNNVNMNLSEVIPEKEEKMENVEQN